MNKDEFFRQQQAAVERMREMNKRANTLNENKPHKMPPVPSFVKMPDSAPQNRKGYDEKKESSAKQNYSKISQSEIKPSKPPQSNNNYNPSHSNSLFNIPFLDNILTDGDSTLIIGLLLILMSENTDKMLLFALIYILL